MITFICDPCARRQHSQCKNVDKGSTTWCPCQHRNQPKENTPNVQ